MSDQESTQETQDIPAVIEQAQDTEPPPQSPWEAHAASESSDGGDPLPVAGAAFVGGFVLAKLLKKLRGGDEE